MVQPTQGSFSGGEKILITGVTGFIGRRLALTLADEGYRVAGLVRKSPSHDTLTEEVKEKIEIYEGNLRDAAALSQIIRDFSPDAIAHLGAITPVSYSFDHPQEVTEVNYVGTINLAEAARSHVPHLQKFIFASSMEVYGRQEVNEPFSEDLAPKPNCPYAVAKLSCEKYLSYLNETYDFPSIALRQTNTYGRKYNDYFVVEAFATDMIENEETVNFGNPDPYRNFIHIDDLVDLYIELLENDADHMFGEVYNTGPDNAVQIRELAEKIRELTGFDGDINWRTREMRPGEVFYLNSKNEKLHSDLGWEPTVTLDEGLEQVVDYWSTRSD